MTAASDLAGRVALVTHVTHFVGGASARALADRGATVVCHDETFADADAREAFRAANPGLHAVAEQTPPELVQRIAGDHGALDVLVNNDPFPAIRARIEDANLDDLRDGLEALVVRPFALTASVVPQMRARRAGKIVFVTSAAPFRGLANYSMYVAARGAGNALAVSLARELAAFNVHVNAVAPNFVESPTYFPETLLADPEARAKIESNIPLGRLGKPEEVGALIAFLASPGADFLTGQVIPIAGGWA